MEALKTFKDNLFEKRVGGLRTEHVVSPSDTYNVNWDANEVRLGRMRGDSSSDPYATLYVDHVVSRLLDLKGDEASAALPLIDSTTITAKDIYASEDVYINGDSVSYRLAQAEKRLDQLGFKKAKGFSIQSITAREEFGFAWTSGTFGLYKLGNLTILNGIGNCRWESDLGLRMTLPLRISLPSGYSVDEWWPRHNPSTNEPYPSPFGGQTPDSFAVMGFGGTGSSFYVGANMRFDCSAGTIDFDIAIPTTGYTTGQLQLRGICWANGSLPTPIEV